MAYVYDYAYNSDDADVSSHTGILPKYDVGDTLLFIVHKDGTSGSHLATPTDWTVVYANSIVNEIGIFKKTAVANESAPTTSSSDTDAYQSCIFSIKGTDGTVWYHADSFDAATVTNISWTKNPNTTIGTLRLLYAGYSSTGGNTIENYGKRAVHEESIGVGMEIHYDTIYDVNANPDIQLTMCQNRSGALFQIEVGDDGNNLYESSVDLGLVNLDQITTGALNGTMGASSLTTFNGMSVVAGTLSDSQSGVGFAPFQRASMLQVDKDASSYGIQELTFNNTFDLTNKLLLFHTFPFYAKYHPVIGLGTKGTCIFLTDSSGNWKAWNIDAADANVLNFGPQFSYLLDTDSNTTVESSGTLDITSIKKVGIGNTGRTQVSKFIFSRICTITTSTIFGGNTTLKASLNDLIKIQEGAFIRPTLVQGSDILVQTPIQIGNGINTTIFKENGKTIEYPTQYNLSNKDLFYNVSDNKVGFSFNLTSNCNVEFNTVTIQSTTPFWFKFLNSNGTVNLNSFVLRGTSNTIITDNVTCNICTFDKCSNIQTTKPNFTNVIIENQTSTYGLTLSDPSNMSDVKFIGYYGKTAIYVPASVTGTITLDNITFDGSGTDIYWAGTSGTLTIVKSNGTNISTSATGGGTVNIVSSVSIDISVKDESGASVSGAYVYIDEDLQVAGSITNTTTDANGNVSTSYSGSATTATVRVRKYGFKPNVGTISLTADSSTNIILIADPQQN